MSQPAPMRVPTLPPYFAAAEALQLNSNQIRAIHDSIYQQRPLQAHNFAPAQLAGVIRLRQTLEAAQVPNHDRLWDHLQAFAGRNFQALPTEGATPAMAARAAAPAARALAPAEARRALVLEALHKVQTDQIRLNHPEADQLFGRPQRLGEHQRGLSEIASFYRRGAPASPARDALTAALARVTGLSPTAISDSLRTMPDYLARHRRAALGGTGDAPTREARAYAAAANATAAEGLAALRAPVSTEVNISAIARHDAGTPARHAALAATASPGPAALAPSPGLSPT